MKGPGGGLRKASGSWRAGSSPSTSGDTSRWGFRGSGRGSGSLIRTCSCGGRLCSYSTSCDPGSCIRGAAHSRRPRGGSIKFGRMAYYFAIVSLYSGTTFTTGATTAYSFSNYCGGAGSGSSSPLRPARGVHGCGGYRASYARNGGTRYTRN